MGHLHRTWGIWREMRGCCEMRDNWKQGKSDKGGRRLEFKLECMISNLSWTSAKFTDGQHFFWLERRLISVRDKTRPYDPMRETLPIGVPLTVQVPEWHAKQEGLI
jgi:hypothetical protein